MRCYISNTIDLKIGKKLYNFEKTLDAKFQFDRIKNAATHFILVQVWFHGYRPRARCFVLGPDDVGDLELAFSSEFKMRRFKEKTTLTSQVLHHLTRLVIL